MPTPLYLLFAVVLVGCSADFNIGSVNDPPQVTITDPNDGDLVDPGELVLQANIVDPNDDMDALTFRLASDQQDALTWSSSLIRVPHGNTASRSLDGMAPAAIGCCVSSSA